MRVRKAQGILPHSWIIPILWLLCASMFCYPEPMPLAQMLGDAGSAYAEAGPVLDEHHMSARLPQEGRTPATRLELLVRAHGAEQNRPELYSGGNGALPCAACSTLKRDFFSPSKPPLWLDFSRFSRPPPLPA